MAAGNFQVLSKAILNIAKNLIDLDTHTLVWTLHSSSYTPTPNTHETWADFSASELSTAGGYTAGGTALSSVSVTQSGAAVTFDAADININPATFTFKYIVVTKRAGGSLVSGDLVLGYCDMDSGGGSIALSGANYTIQWNASGIFTITRTA